MVAADACSFIRRVLLEYLSKSYLDKFKRPMGSFACHRVRWRKYKAIKVVVVVFAPGAGITQPSQTLSSTSNV